MKKQLFFISRNIWFYTTFSRLSSVYRYSLTGVVLGVLFLLWYLTAYRTLLKMQYNYRNASKNFLEQKVKLHEAQKHMRDMQNNMDIQKNSMRELVSSSLHHALNVQELFIMMQKNNLQLQSFTPQSEQVQPWYTKKVIHLECLGAYEDILMFLEHITVSKLSVVCSYMHMEKQHNKIFVSLDIAHYDFSKVLA